MKNLIIKFLWYVRWEIRVCERMILSNLNYVDVVE